jgi:hypothetical protein
MTLVVFGLVVVMTLTQFRTFGARVQYVVTGDA